MQMGWGVEILFFCSFVRTLGVIRIYEYLSGWLFMGLKQLETVKVYGSLFKIIVQP